MKNKKRRIKIRDPNAEAMWGRTKSQVFVDKTKYNRKKQSKADLENY